MAHHNMKKSAAPGAAPAGYTRYYFDTNGALHVVQDDGTDVTISAQTLAALADMAISGLADLQQLRYNASLGKWQNFTPSSSGQKTAADRLFLHANYS